MTMSSHYIVDDTISVSSNGSGDSQSVHLLAANYIADKDSISVAICEHPLVQASS